MPISASLLRRRYQLIEELGRGGMGVVYRAKDRLGGLVALKRTVVDADGWIHEATVPAWAESEGSTVAFAGVAARTRTIDPSHRLALTQEFRTLASLRHPNIIGVLDYGFDDHGLPYYTMELLEGGLPLEPELARARPETVAP